MIKDSAVLRQYAGWVTDSKMPAVYEHLEDGEASDVESSSGTYVGYCLNTP
jgi:hypothetical protein